MFSMGNAFRIRPNDPNHSKHIWVIASDPQKNPDRVVLVSMSSMKSYKECVCKIDQGEHPDAKNDSVIEYRFSIVVSVEIIAKRVRDHVYRPRTVDFSQELLDRIHEGARNSRLIPYECEDIFEEQELLPP